MWQESNPDGHDVSMVVVEPNAEGSIVFAIIPAIECLATSQKSLNKGRLLN
jgi:hypothetical protein